MEYFIPVSQLPDAGNLSSDDLILVSRETSGGYESLKSSYGKVSSDMARDIRIWDAVAAMMEISSVIISQTSSSVKSMSADAWVFPGGPYPPTGTYVPPDVTNDPKILYGLL